MPVLDEFSHIKLCTSMVPEGTKVITKGLEVKKVMSIPDGSMMRPALGSEEPERQRKSGTTL